MSRHAPARRLLAALALAALGLFAAACGDDDDPVTTEGDGQTTEEEMTDDSMAEDEMTDDDMSDDSMADDS